MFGDKRAAYKYVQTSRHLLAFTLFKKKWLHYYTVLFLPKFNPRATWQRTELTLFLFIFFIPVMRNGVPSTFTYGRIYLWSDLKQGLLLWGHFYIHISSTLLSVHGVYVCAVCRIVLCRTPSMEAELDLYCISSSLWTISSACTVIRLMFCVSGDLGGRGVSHSRLYYVLECFLWAM